MILRIHNTSIKLPYTGIILRYVLVTGQNPGTEEYTILI
jgi:hypothetical protein